MSERLLYCCSIILPLIILQFYCRSAAELAHTILFFFLSQNYDFRVKDLTFILPLVLVLLHPIIGVSY